MKKLLAVVGAGLLVFAMALAYTPQTADAQATVTNKADGTACGIFTPNGFYIGAYVEVTSDSGKYQFTCQGELVAGPGVTKGTVHRNGVGPNGSTCLINETPSGRSNANCHA